MPRQNIIYIYSDNKTSSYVASWDAFEMNQSMRYTLAIHADERKLHNLSEPITIIFAENGVIISHYNKNTAL